VIIQEKQPTHILARPAAELPVYAKPSSSSSVIDAVMDMDHGR